jgi:membrane-bound ClpP family serine protease
MRPSPVAARLGNRRRKWPKHLDRREVGFNEFEKNMLRTLVAFLPDSMMVFVIVIIGLCLMVGALSPRKAKQWLGYVILLLVAAPFCDIILNMLPTWLWVVLVVIAAWMLFRFVAEAILGREGASHMMGILAADVVRGAFRLLLCLVAAPFRLLRYALRTAR